MNESALPELPGGWVWARLGEIGEINQKLNGENIGDDTEVTFLPMRCVEELTGRFDLSITKKFSEVKKGYTPFIDGDLLFAKITPCMENGKVAIVHGLKNCIGFGSTEFHVIRLPELFPKKFFFYFLIREELRKDAQRNMTGSAGQLRVPASYIQQILIPLPPLSEQRRIVTKIEELFTKLDAGVSELKKTQAQLKRYHQSVLKTACEGKLVPTEAELAKAEGRDYEHAEVLLGRILKERREKADKGMKYKEPEPPDTSRMPKLPEGWGYTRLELSCNLITKGESPNWQGFDYVDEGIPFIRSENVLWGNINLSNYVKIPEEFHKKLKRSHIMPNDVLINLVGASIGRCGIVPSSITDANINQAVALIRLNYSLLPSYLMHLLLSPQLQKKIHSGKVETARPNISLEDLRQLVVPVPPLAEQRRIVAEVERRLSIADGVEKTAGQSLAQAQRLRQSILKKAYEGRLVAQDASDEPAGVLLERIKREKSQRESKKRRRG